MSKSCCNHSHAAPIKAIGKAAAQVDKLITDLKSGS